MLYKYFVFAGCIHCEVYPNDSFYTLTATLLYTRHRSCRSLIHKRLDDFPAMPPSLICISSQPLPRPTPTIVDNSGECSELQALHCHLFVHVDHPVLLSRFLSQEREPVRFETFVRACQYATRVVHLQPRKPQMMTSSLRRVTGSGQIWPMGLNF